MAGVPPDVFVDADPLMRALYVDVANRAWALTVQRDDALASRIINRLSDAMRK